MKKKKKKAVRGGTNHKVQVEQFWFLRAAALSAEEPLKFQFISCHTGKKKQNCHHHWAGKHFLLICPSSVSSVPTIKG